MLAGTVEHDGRRYRVFAHYPPVSRVAAAASLGIDGYAGQAEVSRFFMNVIDNRDRERYLRNVRRQPGEDVLGAKCIAVILAHAARSPDTEVRQWAVDMRAAIVEFRNGNTAAFTQLAYAYDLKWAS